MTDNLQEPLQPNAGWSRRGFLKTAGYVAATVAASNAIPDGTELFAAPSSAGYKRILIPRNCHEAVKSAAQIMARNLAMPPTAIHEYSGKGTPHTNEIMLMVLPDASNEQKKLLGTMEIKQDGYAAVALHDGLLIVGARPRSLLFAAGEPHHWKALGAASSPTTLLRNPSFALRISTFHNERSVAEMVAMLGTNFFTASMHTTLCFKDTLPEVYQRLSAADQQRFSAEAAANKAANAKLVQEFHDADVTIYANLPYGNNFSRWSPALYEAAMQVYPSAKGTPEQHSWEKAALCPSDQATWKIFGAAVKDVAEQTQADGLSATFWDQFGIFCHDERCRNNGLDQFKNEVQAAISHYHAVLAPMGKKLHMRTWSSGCPHWLGDQYVHAPGYGQFSESHYELWSRVVHDTSPDILMQTKVYHSDCEPDPPFDTMLGKCNPHTEIVEYQITGQTLGRHYFPASTVDFTARTLKRSLELVGPEGGAEIDAGGTHQSNYNVYDDILNNSNVFAWRELTWNVNADLDQVWLNWATPIYGEQAAPHIVKAMRLSEEAVYRTFSPLGFGSDTNSGFAGNIQRRETLLRYTNRYYLPEYAKKLQPMKENIDLIVQEKTECLHTVDAMFAALESAKPHLAKAQADELSTRFDWLREFALCNTALDIALWRYRYLRNLQAMLTTDPAEMKPIAAAFDLVHEHATKLFRYDPSLKFSCYDTTLGNLHIRPSLGSPLPLMKELYAKSAAAVVDSMGPEGIPASLLRQI